MKRSIRRTGNGTNIAISVLLQQEETRRVSDAVNSKMESGEALPERSDRERDVTGRGDKPPPYEAFAMLPLLLRHLSGNAEETCYSCVDRGKSPGEVEVFAKMCHT